jgi:hypothetical protein
LRHFFKQTAVRALIGIVCITAPFAQAGETVPDNEPLLTVRSRDRVTLHARSAYLTFTETIVVSPAGPKKEQPRAGTNNVIHLLIAPFWVKDGNFQGPAFPVLRPQLTISHGRVQRFAMVRPDGESVRSVAEITPECRYVLTLEFGHMMPEQLTVTVQMSSPNGLNPGAELTYKPSNDGHPFRSGPPESFHTVLQMIADPVLEPWKVMDGDREIPRADAFVTLDRDVSHTIRFGRGTQ